MELESLAERSRGTKVGGHQQGSQAISEAWDLPLGGTGNTTGTGAALLVLILSVSLNMIQGNLPFFLVQCKSNHHSLNVSKGSLSST